MPATVALHCEVALGATDVGVQLTETDVMVEVAAVTATVAVPAFALFCVLVAVTVTDPAALGAVNMPLELIVPALEVHVTAEL
ncbi:MAG TPA: hypothetical protein VK819_04855 [Acidobacteriaceae bacterium]|nr:hypothetical protein [Acidobacteriaceae bacterium]